VYKKWVKMNLASGILLFFIIMSSIIAMPIQYSEAGASNTKPVLMPIGDQKEDEGDTSEVHFSATDDDDILTFTSSTLPRFAVLIDNGDGTAKLVLATSLNDAGTYQITITVTDNGSPNQSDSETFDLVINDDGDEPEVIEIESDVNGDLVVTSNQVVFLTGVTVDGNLQVNGGGVVFITESSIIKGNIESNGGTVVINQGSTIYGNVDIGVSGPGGVLEIEEGNVFGNLITNGIDTLTVIGSYVDGNIFSENDSNVTITGNTVNGNLEILGPSNCSESSNNVNGNNSGCT